MNYRIRCVVMRTMLFHVKKKEQNDVVLSDTVPPPSSPRRATGEDRNLCFSFISSPHAHSPS
jgi:hypothetical protein